MLGRTYDAEVCSIARALEVVGERWSVLIVRNALFAGSTRFGDFQRSLGIATNVLASRLDGFVAAGIMERRRYSEQPEAYEYLLTAKGRDLAPALIALTEWGDRWAAPDGPPVLYRHATCGSAVTHEVVCATCGPVDEPAEVRALPGPGMPADRRQRMEQRAAGR
ncbi:MULTISPECIES: winged helix-turn-helix transcriptional regulator [unclassified Blastococcus]